MTPGRQCFVCRLLVHMWHAKQEVLHSLVCSLWQCSRGPDWYSEDHQNNSALHDNRLGYAHLLIYDMSRAAFQFKCYTMILSARQSDLQQCSVHHH